ncbi:thioredoxin-disulfide reductase [Clostridiaceae bacterium]|nr:thioredoxin-disulfide reductase [Clostridiaceae bacterium]RKI17401.1 thioredoxin-disulfide reductase [bacterium 1XD21-70]
MIKSYDLVIVGSGPAGLAAAIYAQRAKLDTLVLEKEMMSGGQVLNTYEVDNYPGLPGINGFDLGMKFRQHAEKLAAEFVQDEVQKIELVAGEDRILPETEELQVAELRTGREAPGLVWKKVAGKRGEYLAKTVIIASGATHRRLEVPGEDELAGKGISYCATCDGAFFKRKVTAVVGGGDVALEDAIFLSRMCSHVYLIHRRDELRGAKTLQERVMALDNVTVVWDSVVERILGEQRVDGLALKNVKTGKASRLDVDGVFIAVGITPNSKAFAKLLELEHGYIRADENGDTGIPGVYAAGDVRAKQLRQIVTAVADGANAVTSAEHYLAKY